MPRFISKRTFSKGSMPGSLIFEGELKQDKTRFRVMQFDLKNLIEEECDSLELAFGFVNDNNLTWINIDGLHETAVIEEIGTRLNIHSLLLEDMLNTDHRPKFQEEGNHMLVIAKLLKYDHEKEKIEADQISIIAGKNFVITLQERVGTHFDPLRKRIRAATNRVRIIHPDYLTYALLDCMVDNYIEIIGEIGSSIEINDEEIIHHSGKDTAEQIYRHRTEMNFLRKNIFPLKEIILGFMRPDVPLIRKETLHFIKDLNEHVVVSLETIDAYLVMIMDQMNMHNAHLSNKANEIMKTLTIFAAIFIPLTFIAGVYGMNFDVIPELRWKYGYLYFWSLILLISGWLLLYFRKRKWF